MRTAPLLASLLTVAVAAPAVAAEPAYVDRTAVLADVDLAGIQNADLPGSIADDRGVDLGGIGSGLFPTGTPHEYWTITDRGPNGEIGDIRTFVVPEFTPTLVKVRARGEELRVLDTIPLVTPAGDPITGLSNLAGRDEAPYAADGVTPLGYNPNGMDTEGVVRTADGHFWIVDEYAPSLAEVDATGHVLQRFVPAGLEDDYIAAGVDYPVVGTLPAGLAGRRANRGFEDIALLPDGHTVVVPLQSPADKTSLLTTLVVFDTATGASRSFGYEFDAASTFAGAKAKDLKISAVIPVDQEHVIVQERTDTEARFYTVALDPADGILSGTDKELLIDLAGVAGVPGKIEGAALRNAETLVVISDNDFGFVGDRPYAEGEDVADSGVETVLTEVKLG